MSERTVFALIAFSVAVAISAIAWMSVQISENTTERVKACTSGGATWTTGNCIQ